jgi:hypothetical protein
MTVNISKPAVNVREKLAELDKPTGIAGEAMLRAETPQEQFQLINAGRKNLLYNGAMMINQRGTQSGVTSTQYTLDRWLLGDGTDTGTFQVSQSTNVPDGFQNAWLFETTTADTNLSSGTQYVSFLQRLEGQDVKQLAYGTSNAKPVTLSFWVKSSKAGQFASELEISGAVNVQPWTVNQADTWEYKTVTFAGNTSTAITPTTSTGMWVTVCWMAAGAGISGPNFQSGWRALNQTERLPEGIPNMADSTSNIMRFTGVQLEVGKVATPFKHRSYGEELALCQRYYWQINGSDHNYARLGQAFASGGGGTYYRCSINNPVPMRSEPSISVSGTLRCEGTSAQSWTSISSQGNGSINQVGFDIGVTSSAGDSAWIDLGTTGVVKVDAEL